MRAPLQPESMGVKGRASVECDPVRGRVGDRVRNRVRVCVWVIVVMCMTHTHAHTHTHTHTLSLSLWRCVASRPNRTRSFASFAISRRRMWYLIASCICPMAVYALPRLPTARPSPANKTAIKQSQQQQEEEEEEEEEESVCASTSHAPTVSFCCCVIFSVDL